MAGRTIEFHVCRTYGPLEAPVARNFVMGADETVRVLLTVFDRDGDAAPLNLEGMAAFFSFGRDRIGGDGTMVSFEGGQVYFDLTPPMDCFGQMAWRCTLGDGSRASIIAYGYVNVLPVSGSRETVDLDLITPAGMDYDAYSGSLVVPSAAIRSYP